MLRDFGVILIFIWASVRKTTSKLMGNRSTANKQKFKDGLSSLVFISRHTIMAGYYGFTLDVRVCVHRSVVRPSVRILFPDDNLSKHQWIFTKLGVCIDIVETWFEIANGQISSNFDRVICPRYAHIFISFSG